MIEWIKNLIADKPITHVIDILIVWYLAYHFLLFVRGTRATNLLKGVSVIVIAKFLSSVLNLQTIDWLLGQLINWGVIAIIILFQPEIRQGLEAIGRDIFRNKRSQADPSSKLIDDLETALVYMSRRKIGALIVVGKNSPLKEYIDTGIAINADVSSQLLINTFIPNTPLHDGAVIISDFKLVAASCYLPLSKSDQIPKSLGTRHRAAIGLSETTDAVILVVSEETGDISLVSEDHFHQGIDRKELKDVLNQYLSFTIEEETPEADSVSDFLARARKAVKKTLNKRR